MNITQIILWRVRTIMPNKNNWDVLNPELRSSKLYCLFTSKQIALMFTCFPPNSTHQPKTNTFSLVESNYKSYHYQNYSDCYTVCELPALLSFHCLFKSFYYFLLVMIVSTYSLNAGYGFGVDSYSLKPQCILKARKICAWFSFFINLLQTAHDDIPEINTEQALKLKKNWVLYAIKTPAFYHNLYAKSTKTWATEHIAALDIIKSKSLKKGINIKIQRYFHVPNLYNWTKRLKMN